MKRIACMVLMSLLVACGGGGGVEKTTYVPADTSPTTDTTNNTQPDTSPTSLVVPADFDFSNFHTVELAFTVPGDLIGQIDFKIAAEWDEQVQDLYIGRGYASQQRTVKINVPTALESVRIEFMAFDKDSGTSEVRIQPEVSI